MNVRDGSRQDSKCELMKKQDDLSQLVRENFEHHFKVRDAKKYGVIEAILLYNIRFWIAKNKASGKHFHKGRTWTYNSYKAFGAVFPYLSESQIKRALTRLAKHGAILKDNFNKMPYDRTNWYALADESELPIAISKGPAQLMHSNGQVHPLQRTISSD
jgi:hypothetical protein